jgi:hypothetical protein
MRSSDAEARWGIRLVPDAGQQEPLHCGKGVGLRDFNTVFTVACQAAPVREIAEGFFRSNDAAAPGAKLLVSMAHPSRPPSRTAALSIICVQTHAPSALLAGIGLIMSKRSSGKAAMWHLQPHVDLAAPSVGQWFVFRTIAAIWPRPCCLHAWNDYGSRQGTSVLKVGSEGDQNAIKRRN